MSGYLHLSAVTKCYRQRAAVDRFSLEVVAGESIVVLGPSGCGKTTLLRLIAGLEHPDAGAIWIDGRQVAAPARNLVPPYERRVGFVFQDLALWPHLTVRGNLGFVMGSAGVPKRERGERTRQILALARIAALSERYPHQLSGGEQQRTAVARALAGQPRLLLLDEPFSSLDPELRAILRTELSALRRALQLTTIYVTHDREDALALADRVVTMRDGRIDAIQSQSGEHR